MPRLPFAPPWPRQDTEDYDFIEYTVVVKLTADAPKERPSSMRVLGAAEPFFYGNQAGAAGCFLARLYHASCPPMSDKEHFKIAFFFRKSEQGERRAKRGLAPNSEAAERELARRRKSVVEEINAQRGSSQRGRAA